MKEDSVEAAADPHAETLGRIAPAKGPVRLLCDEIGFPFEPRLEQPAVLVAFVRELVGEVADMREWGQAFANGLGGKAPSEGSATVLALTEAMLAVAAPKVLIGAAMLVNRACDRLNPESAYPTDHLIDMVSSCASAIQFGLESPCRSRHAAEAANHIWRQKYRVGLFDSCTPAWSKDWARQKLLAACVSLVPQPTASAAANQVSPKATSLLSNEGGER